MSRGERPGRREGECRRFGLLERRRGSSPEGKSDGEGVRREETEGGKRELVREREEEGEPRAREIEAEEREGEVVGAGTGAGERESSHRWRRRRREMPRGRGREQGRRSARRSRSRSRRMEDRSGRERETERTPVTGEEGESRGRFGRVRPGRREQGKGSGGSEPGLRELPAQD